MKPGVPFDVLLNKDSKRKIQSSVAWKNDDRLFAGDAANIAARFPRDSFSSLKFLQAAPYNSDAVAFYTSVSTAETVETSRKTVGLVRKDGTEWSVEELIGMQFSYVKELAENLAGEKVYETIVTVPAFYSQFERDAVADAVEVAGLRLLAIINDGTAVAVNYAMTRTFATPEVHIVYDAGASAIRATAVRFSTEKGATSLQVLGVGYDRATGGTELDRRLRDLLVRDFNGKHGKDIHTDARGMARLWKEAGRVKAILSANSEARVTVESIAFDIDYKSKVSRAQFEEACADLKGQFAQPIVDALANANLTLDQVNSVIMFGGSMRTPMVKAAVESVVGQKKVAVNVNADEAAVLGAALHGAGLSRQFKTKDIKISDITPYDIQLAYPAEGSKPRTINTLVFPAGSKVNTKKTLTFKRKEDFAITMSYKTPPAPGFPTELLEVELGGIAEAIANLTGRGAVDPVVKATVSLSESGFASFPEAHVYGEVKDESLAGKLKGFFGGGSAETTTAEEGAESGDAIEKKAAPTEVTIPLTLNIKFPSLAPMTVEQKKQARDRLRAIDAVESMKRRREDARNTLEGYMYRLRDLLEDSGAQTPFNKCSQPREREAMREKLEETFTWLNTEGDDAETAQYTDKRAALEMLERPVVHRYTEIEEFPKALNQSQMWNWSTRMFITEAKQNLTREEAEGAEGRFTREDIEGLEKTLKDHEKWLNEWVEKQKAVKMNEDPVILTTEMKARAKTLETHLQRLVRRKVPKRKPTSTSSTTAAKETAAEEGGEAPDVPVEDARTGSTSTSAAAEETPTKHDEL